MSFQPPERKQLPFDNARYKLYVPVPNEKGKNSSMGFAFRRNSIAIIVYTGFSDDTTDKGRIQANLEGTSFFAYLELVKDAIAAPGEFKDYIEYSDFTFYSGKRSDQPEHIATIYVGKDADGTIWTSLVDAKRKDRPRIKFAFGSPRGFDFKHATGDAYTRPETSLLFAKAFCAMLQQIGPHILINEHVQPKPRDNNNNNRGSGGNNNYRSNNSQASAPADDDGGDIPF